MKDSLRRPLALALTLMLGGCLAPTLRPPGLVPVTPVAAPLAEDAPIVGQAELAVQLHWPLRRDRSTQAIPAAANTVHLVIRRASGTVLAQRLFVRPSSNTTLYATASLPVRVSTESLVVVANAYRETIATESAVPTAERIIAQGLADKVTVRLEATTSVDLELDSAITVAGIGGTAAAGFPPGTDDVLTGGVTDPRGPAVWTELNHPAHLRFDPVARYLYFLQDPTVAEEGPRVMRLSLRSSGYGFVTLLAGGQRVNPLRDPDSVTALETVLNNPQGVAVGPDGTVYVAETGMHRIRAIAPDGSVRTVAGGGAAGSRNDTQGRASTFNLPQGLAIDGSNLYIADSGNGLIRVMSLSGTNAVSTLAGGRPNQTGTLSSSASIDPLDVEMPRPRTLALLGTTLYVGTNLGRVVAIDMQASTASVLAGGETGAPTGGVNTYSVQFGELAGLVARNFGGTRQLLLADRTHHAIWAMEPSPTSRLQCYAGTQGAGNGADGGLGVATALQAPQGLALSGTDLYLCDTGNHRIRRLDLTTKNVYAFAGRADGTGDVYDTTVRGTSPLTDAAFKGPAALAADGSGGWYVVDQLSGRLRRITSVTGISTLAASVSTVAGLGSTNRLQRSADLAGKPRQMHFGALADLALAPAAAGQAASSIYVLQSQSGAEGVFQITGLDAVPALASDGMADRTDLPGVKVSPVFETVENVASSSPRPLAGPTSLMAAPDGKLHVAVSGVYHWVMRWLGDREIGYTSTHLVGMQRFAGTGTQGYNAETFPLLVQLDTPQAGRFDAQGNYYFLTRNDAGKLLLRKVSNDASPRLSTLAGGGAQAVPPLLGTTPAVSGLDADLGPASALDLDSQGNLFLAAGSRILRYDPAARTLVVLYDASTRAQPLTFTSIACDEADTALYFTSKEESRIRKLYLSRLY